MRRASSRLWSGRELLSRATVDDLNYSDACAWGVLALQ